MRTVAQGKFARGKGAVEAGEHPLALQAARRSFAAERTGEEKRARPDPAAGDLRLRIFKARLRCTVLK